MLHREGPHTGFECARRRENIVSLTQGLFEGAQQVMLNSGTVRSSLLRMRVMVAAEICMVVTWRQFFDAGVGEGYDLRTCNEMPDVCEMKCPTFGWRPGERLQPSAAFAGSNGGNCWTGTMRMFGLSSSSSQRTRFFRCAAKNGPLRIPGL